jgi:hypothetical protein
MMRPIPPACTLFAVLALACPAQAREPIVTTDLLRLRTVSSIDVARDGSRAVLAVRSIGSAGSEETELVNLSHLFLLDLRDIFDIRIIFNDLFINVLSLHGFTCLQFKRLLIKLLCLLLLRRPFRLGGIIGSLPAAYKKEA